MKAFDYFSNLSYLMIESNSECNLSCSFCNRPELAQKGQRSPKRVSIEEFQQMLAFFEKCPIDTIKLEGISEPTLHPNFAELTTILRQKFPNAYIIIATNLQTDLSTVNLNTIIDNVNMVYLSLSASEDLYSKIHLGGSWKKVISNLEYIESAIAKEIRQKKLFINFTATNENVHTLPSLYQLKEKYCLAKIRINLAQNWSEDQPNNQNFSKECLNYLKQYRQDIMGVGDWQYRDCFWPFTGVVIDVYGNIRQCIINTTQTPIGNIWQDDLKEIYNSSGHYQHTRATLQQNIPTRQCRNCDYKFLSPILHEIFHDPISTNKPRPFSRPSEFINPFPGTVSGSVFKIIPNQKSDYPLLEKSNRTAHSKIRHEFDWLKDHGHYKCIPTPSNFKLTKDCASYQLPYFYNFENFALLLREEENLPLEKIFHSIFYSIDTIHRCEQNPVTADQVNQYLKIKFEEKLTESCQQSDQINSLSRFSAIVINEVEYQGIPWIIKNLNTDRFQSTLLTDTNCSIHGDLTAENILIGPENQIVFIDPNGANIIDSPYIDYAKLLQSFSSHYEWIPSASSFSSDNNKITFKIKSSATYQQSHDIIKQHIRNRLPETASALIQFHEAMNFIRLLPYQIKIRPKLAPIYFAIVIKLFNRSINNVI